MKAIMISIKPKYCALEMNGVKSIEVRKSKALANAIQKLIDEYKYADIYVYCSKDEYLYKTNKGYIASKKPLTVGKGTEYAFAYSDEGKVLFKFRCYKVEEIDVRLGHPEIYVGACIDDLWCLDNGYHDKNYMVNAIHISDLEIFDKPKELSEFRKPNTPSYQQTKPFAEMFGEPYTQDEYKKQCERFGYVLTKAPQNFCYVEVE